MKSILQGQADLRLIEQRIIIEEPCFLAKRTINGAPQEGWVDFVGTAGIEVTADEHLNVQDALLTANTLAVQLGVQRE